MRYVNIGTFLGLFHNGYFGSVSGYAFEWGTYCQYEVNPVATVSYKDTDYIWTDRII